MTASAKCLIISLTALLILTGCKAKEAQSSGFIDDGNAAMMSRSPETPFNRAFWNKKYNSRDYDELLVAPVDTRYVMAQNIWEKSNLMSVSREQVAKDIGDLAVYTRQSFIRAATDDPKKRFKVVDKAGPRTLILEVAIVQLVPSKPVLNALGYVTWIPSAVTAVGSVASGSEDQGKGVVAIEGRVRDGASGEIIGTFADRERPKVAIVDIKALNWWAPAKAVIDDWSKQLIALANRPPGAVVKDSPTFELLIW